MADAKESKWMRFFTTQKFRLDLTAQFMGFINFLLLSITASDNVQLFLKQIFNIELSKMLVSICLGLGFFAVAWTVGYLLDKYNYWGSIRGVQTERNPFFNKIMDRLDKIEEKLD